MKVKLDSSNFQSCDDETTSTTYYGGSIELNGETRYCSGTDRSNLECLDVISDELNLSEEQYNKLYELIVYEGFVGEVEL